MHNLVQPAPALRRVFLVGDVQGIATPWLRQQTQQSPGGSCRTTVWCQQDVVLRGNRQHSLEEHFGHRRIRLWRNGLDMVLGLVGDLWLLIGATIVKPAVPPRTGRLVVLPESGAILHEKTLVEQGHEI